MDQIVGTKRSAEEDPQMVINRSQTEILPEQQKQALESEIAALKQLAVTSAREQDRLMAAARAQALKDEKDRVEKTKLPVVDEEEIKKLAEKFNLSFQQVNIAFAGQTGAGKGTFINKFMNKTPKDPGAAQVGVTETTGAIKGYDIPGIPHIKVWDYPGAGTIMNPIFAEDGNHYHIRYGVAMQDLIVCMYHSRPDAGALYLARICSTAKQPVILVRTKADNDIAALMRDEGCTREEAIAKMRQVVQKDLSSALGGLFTRIPHF